MALATTKSQITKDFRTLNITVAGLPKVGKSTFASEFGDDVYFAATEKGHDFLSILKSTIKTWADFPILVDELVKAKKHKHLVIDVVDNLADMADLEICARNKVKTISDMPFGSGYQAVRRMMLTEFTKLNNAGIGITFVTHCKDKEIKSEALAWTAVATSLPNNIEKQILGMSDLILYAYVAKDGTRKIRTKPTKYIICAGDRSGKLPDVMDLDAKALLGALAK